jgi:hypothetical protein
MNAEHPPVGILSDSQVDKPTEWLSEESKEAIEKHRFLKKTPVVVSGAGNTVTTK